MKRIISAVRGFYLHGVVKSRKYFLPAANAQRISPFFIFRGYRRNFESYELEEVSVVSLCRRLTSRYDSFYYFPYQERIRRNRPRNIAVHFEFLELSNRPFPSSPSSHFQSESKCEIFVMVISSNFNMNKN